MGSIGRIQAALASATNEVTLAAANINFDFTLVKCEAPQEFHPLGNALSRKRKYDAESGSTHITARRLGALFQGLLPETPELIKAYGSRVSEIAHHAKKNFESEDESSIFSEHGGFDGTSIWAAATSSASALHVQLLACMLARVWTSAEAISVWVELVKQRRLEVGKRWEQNEALPYSTLSAATQSAISRDSLAEWDTSTRAWLGTADRAKIKEQDQLMLLIANINIPVNSEMAVYESVVSSWKSAVESMEKLVAGMPQATNSGPCLLALSAWHLYPDVVIVGRVSGEHAFKDPLVHPGGRLTLGLAPRDDREETNRGVFWSLSLAHFNSYGRPPSRLGAFGIESRKFTFTQFGQAVYGAFVAHWGYHGSASFYPSQLLVAIKNALVRGANSANDEFAKTLCANFLRKASHGLHILINSAEEHLEAREFKDDLIHKLMAYGRRKASGFLEGEIRSPPLMTTLADLLGHLKGPEQRVSLLRRLIAPHLSPRAQTAILIRYFVTRQHDRSTTTHTTSCALASSHPRYVVDASAYQHAPVFCRWVPTSLRQYPCNDHIDWMPEDASSRIGASEFAFDLSSRDDSHLAAETMSFVFYQGSPGLAAVFVDHSILAKLGLGVHMVMRDLTAEDIAWCLDTDMVDICHALPDLERMSSVSFGENSATDAHEHSHTGTLRALSKAYLVYQSLPEATITPAIMNKPLTSASWAYEGSSQVDLNSSRFTGGLSHPFSTETRASSRSKSLSCVAYFDSGLDLDPKVMRDVFAIAYEDSIYFVMELSCDPSVEPEPYELKRIAGNIGKPGLTLMIPPENPIMSSVDDSDWRLCCETQFNGKAENAFEATSMHLSFTDYYKPYFQLTGGHSKDSSVFFQESVISVHHCGVWVADIDILKSLSSSLLKKLDRFPCSKQHHTEQLGELVSLERWQDVIELPPASGVIRAHGSWLARIAAVAIFVQARTAQGDMAPKRPLHLVTDQCCLACFLTLDHGLSFSERLVFLD